MFKISSLIFSMMFVFYVGWIMTSTDPHDRLSRACSPVDWMGNITLSLTAFVKPDGQASVDAFFKKTDYACQYSLWRLFYEEDWKSQQSAQAGD
jgi:hypothetical protein